MGTALGRRRRRGLAATRSSGGRRGPEGGAGRDAPVRPGSRGRTGPGAPRAESPGPTARCRRRTRRASDLPGPRRWCRGEPRGAGPASGADSGAVRLIRYRDPSRKVNAGGHGCRPRTRSWTVPRGPGPVDAAVFSREARGRTSPGHGPGACSRARPSPMARTVSTSSSAPIAEEIAFDVRARLVPGDRPRSAGQHRARVQLADQPDHGDAGLPLAGDDGALYRRRAAIARQERGVHVHDAVPRGREQRVGQDLTVGDDHPDVGSAGRDPGREGRVARPLGLGHGDPVVPGRGLHGRRLKPLAPPAGAVGLRHRQHHPFAGRHQALQRRHRERRGPEEGDLTTCPRAGACAPAARSGRVRRPCIRSTNSVRRDGPAHAGAPGRAASRPRR